VVDIHWPEGSLFFGREDELNELEPRRYDLSQMGVPDEVWQKVSLRRRREILLPEGIPPEHARPIRSETRARLLA